MDRIKNRDKVEIWGGAEYSFVRTGNEIYDQLECSGHETRPGDLEYFAELGIRTIRYPLLWEKYSGNEEEFFRLHDSRLNRLGQLGIIPIAGLLHHGSGPFFTDLHDKNFPELLAGFALKIAQHYPWIRYYTPVNEPLTTARFSGLYGHWYPHHRDDVSFARIFLNEIKGIVLSIKAVRSVNPEAGLVQTEDMCRVYSSEELDYQEEFENQRRWLTYDFLLGRVTADHPLRKYFLDQGITDEELDFFSENRIIPEVCGFNYYVTSERYLDHRKSKYPACFYGGNSFQEYADVEVVRANIPERISSYGILKEAWERYNLPVALTEVHLACTREEQLRWFYEAWHTGNKLSEEGVDFRAVTAWSFFGSYDWSSLLCEKKKNYESGIYDIRSGIPRATALAALVKKLNEGKAIDDPLLDVPGWWRRNDRMIYRGKSEELIASFNDHRPEAIKPLLIIGATGSLGNAFARVCHRRGIVFHLSGRNEMDIASEDSVRCFFAKMNPWGVINAAGYARIDDAERAAYSCFRENTVGPVILAGQCKAAGIRFVTFSADQVFNGQKRSPYTEDDHADPLNLYGLSKKIAEEKVLTINKDSLIIRSGFFYNPWHPEDLLSRLLISGESVSENHYQLPSDIILSPSYLPALVNNVLDLMIDGESGLWHMSNQEEISFYDFARKALNIAGINDRIIAPVPSSTLKYAAKRPAYSVLKSSSGIILPEVEDSLNFFIDEFRKNNTFETMSQSTCYTEVQ